MDKLKEGQVLRTDKDVIVTVKKELGSGGQGTVYLVDYDGKDMALKWFKKSTISNGTKFYDNLQNNIKNPSPGEGFLWPKDLTQYDSEDKEASFGYIMDLKPDSYDDFSEYLLGKKTFSSIEALINAGLNITECFMLLHRAGYNYQDLNDGNFFINFDTGDVLICDNDNVMGHGYNSGVMGKPRYMAPEVVVGKKTPDKQTDRYSLSVILFLLFFANHPLEGKASLLDLTTEEDEINIYGKNPIFIMDPKNFSNRPDPAIHKNVGRKWGAYPEFFRQAFIDEFSQDKLLMKANRRLESEWLDILMKLRTDLITCSCGRDSFVDYSGNGVCSCGNKLKVPLKLEINNIKIPVYPGVKLYKYHTSDTSEDYKTVTGEVVRAKNNPKQLGLHNKSGSVWYLKYEGMEQRSLEDKKVARIVTDLEVDFDGGRKGIFKK